MSVDPSPALGVATLLYSRSYLPGVLTLGSQLQNAQKDQDNLFSSCVLVTKELLEEPESSGVPLIQLLESVYQQVIPIDTTDVLAASVLEANKANLKLLDRPELAYTFLKLELWRLTQFSRIVYLDCDTLLVNSAFWDVLKLTEEQKSGEIGAAPDCGWPDMFNSGVLTIIPDLETYAALAEFVTSSESIDGADQGILNQFFNPNCQFEPRNGAIATASDQSPVEHCAASDGTTDAATRFGNSSLGKWIRLPFIYNVTVPNAGYQNAPAARFFETQTRLVHFIGKDKPWNPQIQDANSTPLQIQDDNSVAGSYRAQWWQTYVKFLKRHTSRTSSEETMPEETSVTPTTPTNEAHPPSDNESSATLANDTPASPPTEPIQPTAWDATKQPPPPDGIPEAANFNFETDYPWSNSPTLLTDELPQLKLGPDPIFPWEFDKDAPEPQRVFPD